MAAVFQGTKSRVAGYSTHEGANEFGAEGMSIAIG